MKQIYAALLPFLLMNTPSFGAEMPLSPSHSRINNPASPLRVFADNPVDIELTASSQPIGMVASMQDHKLWVAASGIGSLAQIDLKTQDVQYFPLGTGARPVAVVEMRDGSILALDRALNVIHHLNSETSDVTRIALPPGTPFLDLAGAGVDLENRLWFVGATGWLGSYDPSSGHIEVSSHDDLVGLSLGATDIAGSIWFVAGKAGRMIHIDPQKSRFDSMALPKDLRGVRGLATGAKGEVWLTFVKSKVLARYSGRGTWLVIPLPWPDAAPQAVLAREDGTVLFADAGRRKLVRYTPLLNKFDDIGEIEPGGAIKSLIEVGSSVALVDFGADRVRIFSQEPTPPTQ